MVQPDLKDDKSSVCSSVAYKPHDVLHFKNIVTLKNHYSLICFVQIDYTFLDCSVIFSRWRLYVRLMHSNLPFPLWTASRSVLPFLHGSGSWPTHADTGQLTLHPSGVAIWVPALVGGNVTSAGWQVILCDLMRRVRSRIAWAWLQTTILHFLYFTQSTRRQTMLYV